MAGVRRQGWSRAFETYLDLESAASEMWIFEPLVIHGLLQTEDYALAVERGSNPGSERDRGRGQRAAAPGAPAGACAPRTGRSASGRARGGGPAAGGGRARDHAASARPSAAAGRRRHRRPAGSARSAAGAHPGLLGAFTILEFDDPEDPTVAYIESYAGARYDDQAAQVDSPPAGLRRPVAPVCAPRGVPAMTTNQLPGRDGSWVKASRSSQRQRVRGDAPSGRGGRGS